MQPEIRTHLGLKVQTPRGRRVLQFCDSLAGTLKVYRNPLPTGTYTIGVDVATGKNREQKSVQRISRQADVADETRGARDFSAAQVLEDETGEQVASYHANINPYDVALHLFALAIWFNTALLVVETNNQGHGVQSTLERLGYTNFYVHLRTEKITPDLGDAPEFGFKTTAITRPRMIARAHEMLQHCLEMKRKGHTLIHDEKLIKELSTFEFDDNGEQRGLGRNKDDRVMAWMIANYARLEKLGQKQQEQHSMRHLTFEDRYVWQQMNKLAARPRRDPFEELYG